MLPPSRLCTALSQLVVYAYSAQSTLAYHGANRGSQVLRLFPANYNISLNVTGGCAQRRAGGRVPGAALVSSVWVPRSPTAPVMHAHMLCSGRADVNSTSYNFANFTEFTYRMALAATVRCDERPWDTRSPGRCGFRLVAPALRVPPLEERGKMGVARRPSLHACTGP